MSLRGVIGRLNAASYTVQRREAPTYDGTGHAVLGSLTTLSIIADVQPYDGEEMIDETSGQRVEDTRLIITTTQLYTGVRPADESDAAPGFIADRISIDGNWFTVKKVEPWRSFGSVHYECVAVR